MKNEIVLFENQEVKLEVNMKDETVWLSQSHKDYELEENSVCSFFEHTGNDSKKYNVQYYNLDMIVSVGYCA